MINLITLERNKNIIDSQDLLYFIELTILKNWVKERRIKNDFIIFKVEFPDKLKTDQVTQLAKALKLPKKTSEEFDSEAILEEYHEDQRNTHVQGGTEAYGNGSDDEDEGGRPGMGGAHRMECSNQ